MPIQHAVLALLADGPNYGYQLKANLEATVGPQWGLNIGHLYQVLDRLRRDALVSAVIVAAGKRPDRTMYSITPDGQLELDDWLARPAVRTTGYRDDFFLKLLAATRRSTSDVHDLVRRQRHQHLGELKSLGTLAGQQAHDPFVSLLVRAAILGHQTQLDWLETVDEQAPVLVAAAHALPAHAVVAANSTESVRGQIG
jgi:DNA-binding PadR family transcriptional regulator